MGDFCRSEAYGISKGWYSIVFELLPYLFFVRRRTVKICFASGPPSLNMLHPK